MARRKKLNGDEPQEGENVNESSDDTFGLPEIEYEPLKREEEPVIETVETTTTTTTTSSFETEEEPQATFTEQEREEDIYSPSSRYEEEESSIWPKIFGIALALIVIAAGVWYFVSYKPKQDALALKEKQEQAARDAEAQRKLQEQQAEQARLEAERAKADSLANAKPAEGLIEALSGRTGRYYVVVASAIDDDLIMDFANKLKNKGVSSKIIPPFGKTKFFRLAIAEGETYANAQTTADGLKGGDYGQDVWVVKY